MMDSARISIPPLIATREFTGMVMTLDLAECGLAVPYFACYDQDISGSETTLIPCCLIILFFPLY